MEDDRVGFTLDVDHDHYGKRKASSPWQRMKWTDHMVRLLIMAVYYIGDDQAAAAGSETVLGSIMSINDGKKLLQKKGKWKSVSRAMMEKGFYVSPQQCEDKFNDLNKRYKRVNDILGRGGTACKVVEDQGLLDSMDHLSPKLKDEVRKLLNSKHLFFREMCAYHNSCGHPTTTTTTTTTTSSTANETSSSHHLDINAAARVGGGDSGSKLCKAACNREEDESDNDDDDDDHDCEDHGGGEDDNVEKSSQLKSEVVAMLQDGSKSYWEKKHWMKMRLMQLEEEQVSYRSEALELEKERLKWVQFSGKKEREMEKAKLESEKRRLENKRMVLTLRKKELELMEMVDVQHHNNQTQLQHSSNRRAEPSSITG